ncbi:MAG: helicase-related protein [Oscillospiraceae bacterium]
MATTVIEVGVDVPNATVMVVEDADRFGLSQLHQLRGRVGRGPAKSYCILLSNNRNPDTQARLKALCKTGDGFRIAEEDLQLRGPGLGHRQHGLPTFRAANLSMDVSLLQQAQAAAALWIDRHGDADTSEAACLRARVESLFRDGSVAWN